MARQARFSWTRRRASAARRSCRCFLHQRTVSAASSMPRAISAVISSIGRAPPRGLLKAMIPLALPLLALELTGSALKLGVAYFFFFLPVLLFGLVGGVFVDRWDRRLTIVIVDAIRAAAFLSVAVISSRDGLTVTHLYAVIFLPSTLQNFFTP